VDIIKNTLGCLTGERCQIIMKIALVHDHLTQDGGAEKVLKAFQELYPNSPTFTLVYDEEKTSHFFNGKKINTSYLQQLPFVKEKFPWYLSLMPSATEHYNLQDFDVVLSTCSAFAKGVITRPNTIHICYCHTPTRFLWTEPHLYIEELNQNRIVKKMLPVVLSKLRVWDRLAADRVDYFIANSQLVKQRIKKYYDKPSQIIHPPVETAKFQISFNPDNYFLTGGRLVAYKRFDLVIKAFNRLNIPLKVFGIGPELDKLKLIAKNNIEFLGKINQAEQIHYYSRARAFIFPQEEDFGITAVESMASGRPVIAYQAGGALETVKPDVSGDFFTEQTWESLAETIIRFDFEQYNPLKVKDHAEQFTVGKFKEKIKNLVEEKWYENNY